MLHSWKEKKKVKQKQQQMIRTSTEEIESSIKNYVLWLKD